MVVSTYCNENGVLVEDGVAEERLPLAFVRLVAPRHEADVVVRDDVGVKLDHDFEISSWVYSAFAVTLRLIITVHVAVVVSSGDVDVTSVVRTGVSVQGERDQLLPVFGVWRRLVQDAVVVVSPDVDNAGEVPFESCSCGKIRTESKTQSVNIHNLTLSLLQIKTIQHSKSTNLCYLLIYYLCSKLKLNN